MTMHEFYEHGDGIIDYYTSLGYRRIIYDNEYTYNNHDGHHRHKDDRDNLLLQTHVNNTLFVEQFIVVRASIVWFCELSDAFYGRTLKLLLRKNIEHQLIDNIS
jgi:hypothetical protein